MTKQSSTKTSTTTTRATSKNRNPPKEDFSLQEAFETDDDPNANLHEGPGSEEDDDSGDVERNKAGIDETTAEKQNSTLPPSRGADPTTRSSSRNRGAPKSKVAPETEESEESSEDEKKPLTKIAVPSIRSRAADRLAGARISINRMNLLHSPIPLHFGQWNDRSLVERYAKGLQNSFQTQGVRSFEMENMIPLVIRKEHLDSKCINFKGLNAAEAPLLQLSSEGMKSPSIKAAGGRHRFRAVELEAERLSTEIKRLETKIQSEDTTTEEDKDMNRAYSSTIETLSKERERVCMWGVVVYDEGKPSIAISQGENLKSNSLELLLADGEMLATELSRNEKKLQYAESDSESLLMTFRTWRGLQGDKAEAYLKTLGKNLNSGLAQVLNHPESRQFLVALDDMQPHFHYTEPFTTTWIKRYIHGISGGVSIHVTLQMKFTIKI
jgi:hypothetical protein